MKDRNVQHASRFRLTKVPGTDDVYDLIPAPGEVYEEGTLINKSALLKDSTAALFGLGSDAVPDDALAVLSRFHNGLGNEYVWAKTKVVDTIQLDKLYGYGSNTSWTVYRSPTMSESNGVFTLDQRIEVSGHGPSGFADYVGQYFDLTNIYGSATSCVKLDSCTSSRADFYTLKLVQVSTTVGYVNSPDPNAYPPAVSDGYTYTALGQFGNKVQIEIGSYNGTGTYGSANPCSLTFEFEPKAIFMWRILSDASDLRVYNVLEVTTYISAIPADNVYYYGGFDSPTQSRGKIKRSIDGKTITWYSTDPGYQHNLVGSTYYYIAIG